MPLNLPADPLAYLDKPQRSDFPQPPVLKPFEKDLEAESQKIRNYLKEMKSVIQDMEWALSSYGVPGYKHFEDGLDALGCELDKKTWAIRSRIDEITDLIEASNRKETEKYIPY